MSELIKKISSYNLFNYFLSGIIFSVSVQYFVGYKMIQKDIFVGVFLYYFMGLVISRLGSLIIEPVLRKIKFLEFSDYSSYVKASKKDDKIEIFLEVSNMYRTFVAMFLMLITAKVYNIASVKFDFSYELSKWLLIIVMFVIFIFSYKKQVKYIKERVLNKLK